MTKAMPNSRRRLWRWPLYLLIGLAIPVCYILWKAQATKSAPFSFQPLEMALAQYSQKDVIGDLGGMKVRIPRHYAEDVEYDGDPGFGEKRSVATPSQRTFDSKLRSFGMEVRFPDMKGLENPQLRDEYRHHRLKKENPWISIGINAGEIYPSLGSKAGDGLAKKLWEKSDYWFSNYERALSMDIAGLDAYVVAGIDPRNGKPARESDSTEDVYIHKAQDHVSTYISCGRTSVKGGIASCIMYFGLEPKAKVRLRVSFYPALLPMWQSIRQSVSNLIYNFEVSGTAKQ